MDAPESRNTSEPIWMGKTFSEGRRPCSPADSRRIPRAGPASTLRVTGGTDKTEASDEGRVDLVVIELVFGRELCLLVTFASPDGPPLLRRAEVNMDEVQHNHLSFSRPHRQSLIYRCLNLGLESFSISITVKLSLFGQTQKTTSTSSACKMDDKI
jgi:hypothetical protein